MEYIYCVLPFDEGGILTNVGLIDLLNVGPSLVDSSVRLDLEWIDRLSD